MYGAHSKPSIDMAIGMVVFEEHARRFWMKSNSGPATPANPPSIG